MGQTTTEIMNDLRNARTEQYSGALRKIGRMPKKSAEALTDGFREGFRDCLSQLVAMGIVEIVTVPADGEEAPGQCVKCGRPLDAERECRAGCSQ